MTVHERLAPALALARAHGNKISAALTLLVLGVAGLVLWRVLDGLDPAEIGAALRRISAGQIALSLALAALSYLVLTGYDVLALHAIGKPQRYWRAALGSFTAYVFSHNLGFAPVTGAAARWRAYQGTNVTPADVARLVVIAGVTFWLGIFLLLGVCLLLFPGALRVQEFELAYPAQAALGAGILLAILLYLVACARARGPIHLLGWTLPVPSVRQALIQFALASADIAVASAALLVLLPSEAWHHYPDFVVAYVVAMVVALITHAPGGLGVFEAVILVTLPEVGRPELVSALILYRVIYYWLPLGLAFAALGAHEGLLWRRRRAVQAGDREARLDQPDTL